jgi:hypothetical protein
MLSEKGPLVPNGQRFGIDAVAKGKIPVPDRKPQLCILNQGLSSKVKPITPVSKHHGMMAYIELQHRIAMHAIYLTQY